MNATEEKTLQRLKRLVDKHGLRETARRLSIHWTTLYNWVHGVRNPKKLTLEGIATRLRDL